MDGQPALSAVLRRHLEPSWQMLVGVIDKCPDGVWTEVRGGFPFWQQVMHALQDVRYWLRTAGDPAERPDQPVPELGTAPPEGFVMSKEEVSAFAAETRRRVERFLEALDRGPLSGRSPVNPDFTPADAVLHQIRHITYHVGHCDAILRELGLPAVRWLGFGE